LSYFDDILSEILTLVQVDDSVLSEARARRNAVLDATAGFDGRLRTYHCGSLAYGTAIKPPANKTDKGVDGDGGMVLNRKTWTTLGPDSDAGEGPVTVIEQIKDYIRPRLKVDYPHVRVGATAKRAIRITFRQPLPSGEDPPVELIVALTRKGAVGLWIPNLITDGWDAAHPEKHRHLINDVPSAALRIRRARIVRLGKHWNKIMSTPTFSSFHLQALALETLTEDERGRMLRSSLQTFFESSADSLEENMTQDPAGVSGAFHLENDNTKEVAVQNLRDAAAAICDANASPNDREHVRECLKRVFGEAIVDEAHDNFKRNAYSSGNSRVQAGSRIEAGRSGTQGTARKNPSAWAPRP
jgi:hypothetical protein